MLNTGLVVAFTVLAQGVPTESLFRENEEAIVYTYRAEMERKGQISRLPVAAFFASFVNYEKATFAEDRLLSKEMESRGEVFSVESGTRCQVIQSGGMSVGPIVRSTKRSDC